MQMSTEVSAWAWLTPGRVANENVNANKKKLRGMKQMYPKNPGDPSGRYRNRRILERPVGCEVSNEFDDLLAGIVVDVQHILRRSAADEVFVTEFLHRSGQFCKGLGNIEIFEARHGMVGEVQVEFADA